MNKLVSFFSCFALLPFALAVTIPLATAFAKEKVGGSQTEVQGPKSAPAQAKDSKPERQKYSDAIIREKYSNEISEMEGYLNGFSSIKLDFVQNEGKKTSVDGKIFFQKPNKIRVEYNKEKVPLNIVANGSVITYEDTQLDQLSHIPTSKTILFVLFANKIKFDSRVGILNVTSTDKTASIEFYKADSRQDGSYVLEFTKDPTFNLSKIIFKDLSGGEIASSIKHCKYNEKFNNDIFVVKNKKLRDNQEE